MGKFLFRISDRSRQLALLAGILLVAAGLKIALLVFDRVPFNSDEAVVGLMARHILAGEQPIFFYGQAYMGSLDGWLVALAFAIFGQQVWAIRLVQTVLYLLTILSTVYIGKEFLGSLKIGLGAGLLLAIPTVNVTLYSTASLGGYGEALLIGNGIIIACLQIARQIQSSTDRRIKFSGWWLALGFLAGLGLWANGLTLIYTIPAGLAILILLFRKRIFSANLLLLLAAAAGFLIGSFAWWLFALQNGFGALFKELLGGAVAVEGGTWLARVWQHLINLLLLGGTVTLGFRPPWNVIWLVLPLIPVVLFIWMEVFVGWSRLTRQNEAGSAVTWWVLAGICLTLTAGFLLTSFGVDPSGRYFVPLAIPFSLAASAVFINLTKRIYLQYAGFAVLLIFNLWGTIQCAQNNPPGITTQFYTPAQVDQSRMGELIGFLASEGITRGYTNYWVAYPLAFLSQEEIIFTPRLPYHTDLRYTERDDRYAPYQQVVAESDQVAYITSKNPTLDEFIVNGFRKMKISWQEKWIGDFHLFYDLSKLVRPQEIGLGTTTQ